MRLVGNEELDKIEEETVKKEEESRDILKPKVVSGLLSHLSTLWQEARNAKIDIENQMLKNLRQVGGDYDPTKLAEIKEFGGSETFSMLTNTKCRDALAWIKEILIQPGEKPWGLNPTPLPELPVDIMEAIVSQVREAYIQKAVQEAYAEGTPLDIDIIENSVQEDFPEIKDKIQQLIKTKSKEAAGRMEKKIDDQLTEGNFYRVIEDILFDLIVLKGAFIKGPTYKKVKHKVRELDTGGWVTTVKEEVIPIYERRSPFNIYPSPDSTGIDDGYLFDKISMTPMELQDLIGVKGYDGKEIRKILDEYRDGGLHEWTDIDTELTEAEGKSPQAITASAKIDCLEFHGFIQGFMLKDYGVSVEDREIWYAVTIWKIGDHIIRAMLNPDDLGKKPYSMAGFEETPGMFWKKGLPEIISNIQDGCNAASRHLINNIGIASFPITEYNEDRMSPGESPTISPGKLFISTDKQMTEAPALRIYQFPMQTDKLVNVIEFFTRQADEQSRIPAYAHGDTKVGGAGSALADYEKVITSQGLKKISELVVGDKVANTYGSFSSVLGVYPQEGLRDIYRITFSDCSAVDCDLNHRWSVKDHQNRKFRTLTTKEILEKGVLKENKDYKWLLPKIKDISFVEKGVKITKKAPKKHIFIKSIEPLKKDTATCITVDSKDSCYLCENYIPTHNTSSGLHMLMSAAARGIRSIVGNIDKGLIVPIIEKQYYSDIEFGVGLEMIPDVKIVAKGTTAILLKEQMALRMSEMLTLSNNPTDNQIIGVEGRKYAYEQYAKSLNLDAEKLIPEVLQPTNPQNLDELAKTNPAMFQSLTGGSAKKPMPTDLAGNQVSGTNERTFGREGR